jgi:hypothetical protein
MSEQPYLRKVEVLVGPLEEWRGGGDKSVAAKFVGDGTNDHFRIKVEVRAALPATANPTIVQIYNLSPALRASLHKAGQSGTRLEIVVGWQNQPMTTIFTGTLLAAYHQRDGADIVTNLLSLAGYGGLVRSTISSTYVPNTPIKDIVYDIAAKIPGITVDKNNIKIPNLQIGSQGLTQFTSAKDALDNLSRTYGFSWTVDNGIFYALDDQGVLSSDSITLSPNRGPGYLMRVEPIMVPPNQATTGVNISTTLNPFINVGCAIKLESSTNPQLNKASNINKHLKDIEYKVNSVTHSVDTHSSTADTRLECLVYGGISGSSYSG